MILKRESFPLVCFCIIIALISSCGKKGEPTLKAYEKPASPNNITALHRDGMIHIFWHYPVLERKKIKGCQLLKSKDEGKSFKELAFLKPDELNYIDQDFILGQDYYYKLRCTSLRDVLSDDSVIIKISPLSPPQKPKEISSIVKEDRLEVRWKMDSGAMANIYKTFEKGSYSLYPVNSAPLGDNFFVDRLETSRVVYYTVRQLRGTVIRDEGPPSDELEINPALFKPSSPSGLNYAYVEKKIYLLWKENPETWVKGYRVYRKGLSEDKFTLLEETAVPVIRDIELFESKTFFYVTAVGPEAESLPSEMLEISPPKE